MFAKQPLRAGYQLQSYTLLEELGRGRRCGRRGPVGSAGPVEADAA